MSRLIIGCAALLAALAGTAHAGKNDVSFLASNVRFADEKKAKKMIGTADAWVKEFGPLDRQMRLQAMTPVDEKEFLAFAAREARGWNDEEIKTMVTVLDGVAKKISALHLRLPLPKTIWMIQTTGHEEADAGGYTRGEAIIVPESQLRRAPEALEGFILHELFHVMTRNDPEIRVPLYAIIGFQPCATIDYPEELLWRKITNPDAFHFDTYIDVKVGGNPVSVIPLTLARPDGYDGGKIFANVMIGFLQIDGATRKPVYKDGEPVLYDVTQLEGFFDKIGRNTNYIFHPEEIMADNFSLAVRGVEDVPNPEVTGAIIKLLSQEQ